MTEDGSRPRPLLWVPKRKESRLGALSVLCSPAPRFPACKGNAYRSPPRRGSLLASLRHCKSIMLGVRPAASHTSPAVSGPIVRAITPHCRAGALRVHPGRPQAADGT
jgi:hypothetical protein